MTGPVQPGSAVYELVIAGSLGPVLQCALARYVSAKSECQTVARAEVPADRDLVDLVHVLVTRGLDIADVHEVTGASPTRRAPRRGPRRALSP